MKLGVLWRKFTLTPKKLESMKSKLVVQELCIKSKTGMKNNSIFYHTCLSCVSVGGIVSLW